MSFKQFEKNIQKRQKRAKVIQKVTDMIYKLINKERTK